MIIQILYEYLFFCSICLCMCVKDRDRDRDRGGKEQKQRYKLIATNLNKELSNCEHYINYVYETHLFKRFLGISGYVLMTQKYQ